MKKLLSILLAVVLIAAILPTAAFADGPAAVLSSQKLRVNGKTIECERYNIEDRNYFKLRDLAYVLDGTGSQFNVDYDEEARQMVVTTGVPYTTPNGTELQIGTDNSATAKVSAQSLVVDGVPVEGLTVYNIGGGNFFQLRELGDTLGFHVDYDAASKTMIVISRAMSRPQPWRIVESETVTNSDSGADRSVVTYDEDGRSLSSLYQHAYYTRRYDYFYNDLGYKVQDMYANTSEYDGSTWEEQNSTTYEYDVWGQMVRSVSTSCDSSGEEPTVTEDIYTFDDDGLLLRTERKNPYNPFVTEYTYNEQGDILRILTTYENGNTYTIAYERDEEGRILRTWDVNSDGETVYSYEYEYEGDLKVRDVYVSRDYRSETTYTYDERGNLLRREADTTDWDNFTEYTYDEEDRVVKYVYYDGADMFVSLSTYDEDGRIVREEYTSPDDSHVYEYTYNERGDPLTEVYTGNEYTAYTTYTYDLAESRQTRTTRIEYPPAEELFIGDTELTLAVGDEDYLYYYFMPYNCVSETVTWSSSDESVAQVDETGTVLAVGAGTAEITVTSSGGLTATCTVNVVKEKFTLNVAAEDLVLDVGEEVPVFCYVTYVGNYMTYKLRFVKGDAEAFTLKWGPWEDTGWNLYVTGLKAGSAIVQVQVISDDEQSVYTAKNISITVKDDNTAEKP